MGITEFIAAWGTQIIDATGYAGVFFLMVLESLLPPVPSEAIMPFVGFLVAEGSMSAAAALGLATLGSLVGSLAFYALGRYGGRPFIARYGKVLRLDPRGLDVAEHFFQQHGAITILVGRFIPLVRPLISIPAGIGRMHLLPFCVCTVLGATAWNAILVACGVVLRRNWSTVMRYSKWLDIAVLVALAGLVAFAVIRRMKRRRQRKN